MYTIIDSGRVAGHLARYLEMEGIPFFRWARRMPGTPGPHWCGNLEEAIQNSNQVILAVSDRAIEPFVRSRPALAGRTLVHCAGSLVTPLACSAHPLMTFAPEPYLLATYRSIPFILEAGRASFGDILPGLRNPHYYIPPELKPLYHCLCVLSGNFTTILWIKFFQELSETIGIPPDVAFPYLRQVAQNLESAAAPLTGPLARDDWDTIDLHLRALTGDPFQAIYRAFVENAGGLDLSIPRSRR
jgi:predicted short-subunit dehydrogenase-like oxidoreductase (DUF2520 family)